MLSDFNRRQLFGGAAVLVFLLTLVLAIGATPGYTIGSRWMSELSLSSGAAYFIPGMILTGILLLGFFFAQWKEQHFWRAKPLLTISLALGGLAALSVIGVGLFPQSNRLHSSLGMAFFWLAGLSALGFLALFAFDKDAKTPKKPVQSVIWASAAFILSDLAFGLSQWRILDNSWLFPLEWITVTLFALWVLVFAWTPDEPIHHSR